jgi:hypothetical protein
MDEQDVFTSVKERFGGVHMTTPLDTVAHRGRALRTRRLGTGLAGGAAAASGLALAVTSLVPGTTAVTSVAGGGHRGGPATLNGPLGTIKGSDGTVKATLVAWTVTKRPDGGVAVMVRDLRDPAGLQRALRADGVPARVTYPRAHVPASCHFYDLASGGATSALRSRVITEPKFTINLNKYANFVVHPSAIPHGAGVLITGAAMPGDIRSMPATLDDNPAEHVQTIVVGERSATIHDQKRRVKVTMIRASFLETSLVHTSAACTGS